MNSPRATFLRDGVLEVPRKVAIRNGSDRVTLKVIVLLIVAFTCGVGMGARLERAKFEREIKATHPSSPSPSGPARQTKHRDQGMTALEKQRRAERIRTTHAEKHRTREPNYYRNAHPFGVLANRVTSRPIMRCGVRHFST